MTTYDRWHLSRQPDDPAARKCPKHRKYPSAEHGIGLQWQVRGTDGEGKRIRRNFDAKADAEAFDADLKAQVKAGTWIDERDGEITFETYAQGLAQEPGPRSGHGQPDRVRVPQPRVRVR